MSIIRSIIQEELKLLSEKTFVLKSAQVKSFDNFLNGFGVDSDVISEPMQSEGNPIINRSMSSSEIEQSGLIIKIDESILNRIEEFIELGKDAQHWYNDLNGKILSTLGESNGTLWLMLFAITSPRNSLAINFRLASQIFIGVKNDISNPETKKLFEKLLEETDLYSILRGQTGFSIKGMTQKLFGIKQYKKLDTIKGMLSGNKGANTTIPNLMRILKLYKSKGYVFSKQDVVQELSKYLRDTGELGKNSIVSAEKVFNFTLNLLSPSFSFEDGWMPVTIDTWMATFFYPQLDNKGKTALLSKSKNYVYMAKKVQELAPQFGMKPQELQAILWVATIKKSKGEKYASTLNQAIEKNLTRMNVARDEIQKMNGMFNKIIQVVGSI